MSFEKDLQSAIQSKVLKEIQATEFTRLDYGQKLKIPDDVINKIWESIDWNSVVKQIRPEMEKRVCNAIVGNMEKEIRTDVKAILSIDGVRQRLRAEIYPKITSIVSEETQRKEPTK